VCGDATFSVATDGCSNSNPSIVVMLRFERL